MRKVALAIFAGVQALDVAGPLDVFNEANRFLAPENGYALVLVGPDRNPHKASNGMAIVPDIAFSDANENYDIALVAGGPDLPTTAPQQDLVDWIRRASERCPQYGAICTGTFALGSAGLIDGKTVTTHWQDAPILAAKFPQANVELDRIYVRDGAMITSAGVTAGIDLGLAILHEHHGPEIALAVAKRLVVVAQRQGGQSQFSPHLMPHTKELSPITAVHAYIIANLRVEHTVDSLAAVARMSSRTFARAFKEETMATPAEFVESVRIDTARNRLEATDLQLKSVAYECGFSSAEHMRLAFVRRLRLTPTQYRQSFQKH